MVAIPKSKSVTQLALAGRPLPIKQIEATAIPVRALKCFI